MVNSKNVVRFIISCPARSGSTMLNVLLASHVDILCHGEALVGDETVGFLGGEFAEKRVKDPEFDRHLVELRETNPLRFLQDVIFNPQGHACVGAKFKTDEAFLPQYEPLQSIIRDDHGIKILMLRRRNVLAQYVSHNIVAKQTGTHLVRGDTSLPVVNRIDIDIEHCLDYARDIIRRRLKAEAHYVNHPLLDIDYEDLVSDRAVTTSKILEFLQAGPHELATDTKKILRPPSELVINFDAVKAALIKAELVTEEDLLEPESDAI